MNFLETQTPNFHLRKRFLFFIATFLTVLGGASLHAQSVCNSQRQCFITIGGAFQNAASQCTSNHVDYIRDRFLASHFDNGTPNDFTDDPIVIGFGAGANLFGRMQDPNNNNAMALPSVSKIVAALSYADDNNLPFVIHLNTWGCQRSCSGQPSATLNYLRGFEENFMLSPEDVQSSEFPEGMIFPWCNRPTNQNITYPLHPEAGHGTVGGNLGLQDLFDRNLTYLAQWIKENIYDDPAKRRFLIGIVISGETHFGDRLLDFDYSDVTLAGYRQWVIDQHGCNLSSDTKPSSLKCNDLDRINSILGTNFASLDEIAPPVDALECGAAPPWCNSWKIYRIGLLKDYLERITGILVGAGIPASDLYTHELVSAGMFIPGPLEIANSNPGLTAYGRSDAPLFNAFACNNSGQSCQPGRPWAVVEGYFISCGGAGGQDPTCYADSLDSYFESGASFLHQMPVGNGGERLLGSNLEKGIHLWGMRYSDRYQSPTAEVDFDPATGQLSGCVYDLDQVWRGEFPVDGSISSMIDANDVRVVVEVDGVEHTALTAEVARTAPWCGTAGENFTVDLSAVGQSASIRVTAEDYPSDESIEIFCRNCDDSEVPAGWIDDPTHQEVTSGSTLVKGWATDNSGLEAGDLVFEVDGEVVQLEGFTDDLVRADVCSAHEDPDCPRVGWLGLLDTTQLSNGNHTLRLTMTDSSQNTTIRTRNFSVENSGESDPPGAWIDDPVHQEVTSGSTFVKGWASDESGLEAEDLVFEVDGQPVQLQGFVDNLVRSDVCASHEDPDCPRVGWSGWLNTAQFANGNHTLRLTVTDPFQNITVRTRNFSIENSAESNPPAAWIDDPVHQLVASGLTRVKGWATDDSGLGADNLVFEVNGQPVQLQDFVDGTVRNDACANNQDPDCPNVGWLGWLDTTQFANGSYTLKLTVTDPFNNTLVRTRSFSIQN